MSGASALGGGSGGDLEAAVRSIIARNGSEHSFPSSLSIISSPSDPQCDSNAYPKKVPIEEDCNKMLSNLMAESVGGYPLPSPSPSPTKTDTALDVPLPMDIDEERIKVNRKRSAQVMDDEVKLKVPAAESIIGNTTGCNMSSHVNPSSTDPKVTPVNKTINDISVSNIKPNMYSSNDLPPYVIYVYSGKASPIHFSLLSRIISEAIKNDILLIKRLGAGKAIIEVKSADAANRLLSNPVFEKNNLRAFIPSFKVLRTGILKGVDQAISTECVKDNLTSTAKILDIQRLNRRMKINGKTTYVPSRTFSIKFAGQKLPREVVLFNAIYKIEPFVPKPKLCFACYRVGHLGRDCKSTRPRCLFCGISKEDDHSCPNEHELPKCINCEGDHLATSYSCPIIIRHKNVLELAAQDNIPLVEARRIVASNNPTSFPSQNITQDFRNFPYLRTNSTYTSSPSVTATTTKHFNSPSIHTSNRFHHLDIPTDFPPHHSHVSYASVVASPSASGQGHNRPNSPKGKPIIRGIESVTGKYKVVPPSSVSAAATRSYSTNGMGYSEEHNKLLLAPNGRSKVYTDEGLPGTDPRENHNFSNPSENLTTKENISTIILKAISFLENCESLVNIPSIRSFISPIIILLRKLSDILSALGFCTDNFMEPSHNTHPPPNNSEYSNNYNNHLHS